MKAVITWPNGMRVCYSSWTEVLREEEYLIGTPRFIQMYDEPIPEHMKQLPGTPVVLHNDHLL